MQPPGTPATRLPDFLIVGAAKSGTTSMARYLGQHPEVFVAPEKELYFFDRDDLWARGPGWYAGHFAAAGEAAAVGEATPSYMYFPWAVERIAAVLPGVRAIACLREPVARTYSHYLHWYQDKAIERRSFARAVEDELAAEPAIPGRDRPDDDPPYFGYLARSRYLPQLERLAGALGRDRVHVLLLEELEADPRGTFAAVCRFLGVDPGFVPENLGSRENAYHEFRPAWLWRTMHRHRVWDRMPSRLAQHVALDLMAPRERPVPPMDPAVRARLAEHFAPGVEALSRWLGRDLSTWRTAG